MTDLPFDFSDTLEAFECPEAIQVYEKEGSYVDGYWQETVGQPRELRCILLNADEKKMEIVAPGKNIEAAYCIMYPASIGPLYYSVHQGNYIESRQTYAIIDGLEYIIKDNPETVKNAGFRSYFAVRYEDATNPTEETNG